MRLHNLSVVSMSFHVCVWKKLLQPIVAILETEGLGVGVWVSVISGRCWDKWPLQFGSILSGLAFSHQSKILLCFFLLEIIVSAGCAYRGRQTDKKNVHSVVAEKCVESLIFLVKVNVLFLVTHPFWNKFLFFNVCVFLKVVFPVVSADSFCVLI